MKTFARLPSTYQLLGLDFMVTHDYRVWLIEANNYPLWPKGEPYIDELIHGMGVRGVLWLHVGNLLAVIMGEILQVAKTRS